MQYALSILTFAALSVTAYSASLAESGTFWDDIPAKDDLSWSACYDGRGVECARLNVPLNYSEPDAGSLVLALIRYPSPYQNNSAVYKGPILYNPGGPGVSGVDEILGGIGQAFSELFEGVFDIVSFDPRGIGRSTQVSFFENDLERTLWGYSPLADLNFHSDGVANAWAAATVTGKLAAARNEGLLQHINTEHTARDMLKITELYGYEKLRYWGVSYGTLLGSTFVAMFPDKVERVVLDGVVDAEQYYTGLSMDDIVDSEKALQTFFDGCYEAGPNLCAFYAPSPEEITANLKALYEKIRAAPIPVVTDTGYAVIDYATLRGAIFQTLYRPYATFSWLAQGLAGLASGSGEAFYAGISDSAATFQCGVPATDIPAVQPEGIMAIGCNDWPASLPDLDAAQAFFDTISTKYDFGSIWAGLQISCAGWPSFPKNHFTGPFTTNTSYPLLIIGNTADPVTPLASAKAMSEKFAGSVLLIQDCPGHVSLSVSSPCTLLNVRNYFIDGTLPELGTVCPVNGTLFPASNTGTAPERRDGEHKLLSIGRELSSLTTRRRIL